MSGCEMIPAKLDKHSGHDMNRGGGVRQGR